MKHFLIYIGIISLLVSCQEFKKEEKDIAGVYLAQEEYKSFGDQISGENALSAAKMEQTYAGLKPGDTLNAKFKTSVNSVCKMKGCWMTLELPHSEEGAMVKFKDYGFFVPKDIEGKEVIVEGLAFVEEISVEDQRHFAEDAGKTEGEIKQINKPKRSLSFLANGVLIKQ